MPAKQRGCYGHLDLQKLRMDSRSVLHDKVKKLGKMNAKLGSYYDSGISLATYRAVFQNSSPLRRGDYS
jgi:hypothetical protein